MKTNGIVVDAETRELTGEQPGLFNEAGEVTTLVLAAPAAPIMPWKGCDPTQPFVGEMIDPLMAEYEQWVMHNVAPRKRAPSPHTVRAYTGDTRQFLVWLADQELPPAPAWCDLPEPLVQLWSNLDDHGPSGIPLLLVRSGTVQSYMEWLIEPGHNDDSLSASQCPRSDDGAYSPSTLTKKRASLTNFFIFTRRRRLTYGNPLEDMDEVVRMPQDIRSKAETMKALVSSQVTAMMQAIDDDMQFKSTDKRIAALRDKAMISLMLFQGLRVLEVSRLDLNDYTPNAHGNQGTLRVFGKGDKERMIVLEAPMQELLDLWLKFRALARPSSTAIFVSLHASVNDRSGERGERMSERSIRDRVDVYLDRIGAKAEGVSCHALRHTYATLYVEKVGKDVDRLRLAASMGHSDPSITQIYIDRINLFAENPAAKLMDLLTPSDDPANPAPKKAPKGAKTAKSELGSDNSNTRNPMQPNQPEKKGSKPNGRHQDTGN